MVRIIKLDLREEAYQLFDCFSMCKLNFESNEKRYSIQRSIDNSKTNGRGFLKNGSLGQAEDRYIIKL